jgi:hypothetical protein
MTGAWRDIALFTQIPSSPTFTHFGAQYTRRQQVVNRNFMDLQPPSMMSLPAADHCGKAGMLSHVESKCGNEQQVPQSIFHDLSLSR